MWIIPKNYKLSSAFAQGMVESKEDLTLLESTIVSSLMWRSKPSAYKTWLQRWKKESWIQHLFTRILKPSHQRSFEEQLTLSLGAILVSRSAKLAKDKVKKIQDTSGRTSEATLTQLDLLDVCSRMSPGTLRLDSPQSSAIWKKIVTEQRGVYSQRKKQTQDIKEKEYLSWQTPTTTDIQRTPEGIQKRIEYRKSIGRKYNEGCLTEQVMNRQKYPTPSVDCVEGGEQSDRVEKTERGAYILRKKNKPESTFGAKLSDAILWEEKQKYPTPLASEAEKYRLQGDSQMTKCLSALARKGELQKYPTPTSRDQYLPRLPEVMEKTKRNPLTNALPDAVQHLEGKTYKETGQLNPYWVEALMGLPQGWTALDGTETEMQGTWDDDSWEEGIPRVIKDCHNRIDRIRMCGNGVVPQTAAIAWKVLSERMED